MRSLLSSAQGLAAPLLSAGVKGADVHEPNLTIEQFLTHAGEFGPYQQRRYLLIVGAWVPTALCTMLSVFANAQPPCEAASEQPWQSVAKEFALVCGRGWAASAIDSLYFVGFGVGAALIGQLADVRGRKPALVGSLAAAGAFMIGSALAPTASTYAVVRALTGVATGGIGVCAFCWSSEFVGPSHQGRLGVLQACFFSIGSMLLAALALLLPSWRALSACVGCVTLLYTLPLSHCDESPRWLHAHGEINDARRVLADLAATNGLHGHAAHALAQRLAPLHVAPPPRGRHEAASDGQSSQVTAVHDDAAGVAMLFRSPLAARTPPILFAWTCTAFMYFGLGLSAGSLGGSLHLNFALSAAVELPAVVCGALLIETPALGRRNTIMAAFFIGAAGLFACAALSRASALHADMTGAGGASAGGGLGPAKVAALVGKSAVTLVFATIFPFTSELYPTVVRSRAVGLCSMSARVGSVAAPQLLLLAGQSAILPMLVYGVCGLLAALWTATLPETLGRPALETIDDVRAAEAFRAAKPSHPQGQNSLL